MATEIYTIDASGKPLGRVASEVAMKLMGKNRATYASNIAPQVKVKIVNASKTVVLPKKFKTKEYVRHSGYRGGLTFETMENLVKRLGYTELFRRTVYGMLPKNKLRAIMIKNLNISE